MSCLQREIATLRQQTEVKDEKAQALLTQNAILERKCEELEKECERCSSNAKEAHSLNFDIVKHSNRIDKEMENALKQEHLTKNELTKAHTNLKDREFRIKDLEKQLKEEHAKSINMVSAEDHKDLKEMLKKERDTVKELEDKKAEMIRSYDSLVAAYGQVSKTSVDAGDLSRTEMRP